MTINDEFEAGINEILDANDTHRRKPDSVTNERSRETKEEIQPKELFNHSRKQFPAWVTFVVRFAAGAAFIALLIKYANNIAFR